MPVAFDSSSPMRLLRPVTAAELRAQSHGLVDKPETLNHRTLEPEPGGLYCTALFGPLAPQPTGASAEPVEPDAPRRTRFAHLALCRPVLHPWAWRGRDSLVAALLELPCADVDAVLHARRYLLEGHADKLLDDEAVFALGDDAGLAHTGSAALERALSRCDPHSVLERLRGRLALSLSPDERASCEAREQALSLMLGALVEPAELLLHSVAVLPPAMRPLQALEGERYTTTDLTDLYRRAVNRNARAARLLELGAPEVILRNELVMLQEAVDALFDNAWELAVHHGGAEPPWSDDAPLRSIVRGPERQPLRSLADTLFTDPAWAPLAPALRASPYGLAVPEASPDTERTLFALGFTLR